MPFCLTPFRTPPLNFHLVLKRRKQEKVFCSIPDPLLQHKIIFAKQMPMHLHFGFWRCCGFTILWLLCLWLDCQSFMHSCHASTKHRRLHGRESWDHSGGGPTKITNPSNPNLQNQKHESQTTLSQNNPWGIVVGGVWYKSSWVGYGISRRGVG